jgi:uncharacterized Tic20 family protein
MVPEPDPPPFDPGASAPLPPAGWYPDPLGQSRWWDGTQWGVAAYPHPAPSSDPRQTAMLAHLLGIFVGFIGPLIIYLTAGKQDPFVRHHSAEALNFQLTVAIASIACVILMFLVIGFFLLPVLIIGALVFEIQGCMAANRGEWWRYPVNIRMVSGAAGV